MAAKKRFYNSVGVISNDDGFSIQLDGREARSPAGSVMHLPKFGLAAAIAHEWRIQSDEIDSVGMPLFSLAVTVVDRVTPQRDVIITELSAYGGNDLLCYRDDHDDLASRQQDQWQPWLDRLAKNWGIDLHIVTGVMPISQPDAVKFPPLIAAYDDWRLGMLHRATSLSGSLVLGLGFLDAVIDDEKMFTLAFLDELWQNEQWGTDNETADRHEFLRTELQHVSRFLALLRDKTVA
ncbi:chaperone [Candidatus Puniceispirillum sp.]|nr:chaperone [Candidatus Puniceispirillum sp.]